MTATCRVETPGIGPPGWDPVTESTIPNPPAIVIPSPCVCRVQAFMRAKAAPQAGQTVAERAYRVSLPAGSPLVDVNCHVVIEAAKDAAMVGTTLYIEDVQYGSEVFQRDLVCTANLG
jgi:hypothetical protein